MTAALPSPPRSRVHERGDGCAGLQHLGGVLGVLLERGNVAIVVPELGAGGTSMMLLMELAMLRQSGRIAGPRSGASLCSWSRWPTEPFGESDDDRRHAGGGGDPRFARALRDLEVDLLEVGADHLGRRASAQVERLVGVQRGPRWSPACS